MLQLQNTFSQTKERFKPIRQELVKVYYCGPTPYNYAHIGNLRAYLFSDSVVRTLRYLGYKVQTVMNVTDIDDKTIRDSQKAGMDLQSFTEKYTGLFLEDIKKLGIIPADTIVPISTAIDTMVEIIQKLLDKGYAYLAEDGSIYYSIKKFPKYGQLAHLDIKGMKSSVRINNDEYEKESVADFALWKAYDVEKDGPNKWIVKFNVDGKEVEVPGRPGWHIECSACNLKHFGPEIDIHMGGIDNIFPHHENEIAQSEAYSGKKFSRYWMHSGHLMIDNKKMSKKDGTFYTLADIVTKVPSEKPEMVYRGFRLMNLQTRYRENFNFTFDRLTTAIQTVKGFDEVLKRLKHYNPPSGKVFRDFREMMQQYVQAYIECLEDDIGTPEALAIVFDCFSFINSGIDTNAFSLEEKNAILDLLHSFDEVLGLFDFSLLESTDIPEEIELLLMQRNAAKEQKNYPLADSLRDQIGSMGYKIVDDKTGSHVEKV
ncbi:MAG: cysteine--tRNA ligase [Candidatus Gracilibacteria bacterium]|nr:cysteine--tRNA ligase [Candidatus Gracilibacteria bacterium]